MNDTGYEIVKRRMETHPEDFIPVYCIPRVSGCTPNSRNWSKYLSVLLDPEASRGFITQTQRDELQNLSSSINLESFNVEVMLSLMELD
tara:strand:+ start:5095 stop:5361 length:267 start_codon:yes stop_codon:yes gene_type:complete